MFCEYRHDITSGWKFLNCILLHFLVFVEDLDEMLQKYRQHDSIDTSFIGKVIGAGVNIIWIGCMTAEGSGSQGLKGKQV